MKKIIVVFIIAGLLFVPGISFAQQGFERGIKEIDRRVREKVEKEIQKTPEKPTVIEEEKEPIKEEGPTTFIKKVELAGTESFPPERFASLTEKYENREVSLGDLKRLAKSIEKEYLEEGFVAACIVPPQDVKEGVVVLKVIESRMGSLDVKKCSFFDSRIIGQYWEIGKDEIIKYYKISRSLQRMNKNPDREVKATLGAGKVPKTTDITLSTTSYFPAHFLFTFDTEGSVATGKSRTGFAGRHNNLLGVDDTLISGYTYTAHSNNVYAYHSVPAGFRGTSIIYGFTRSEAFPQKDYEIFDLRSYSKSASFFMYQDVFSKDKNLGDVYLGLDGNDKDVYTNEGVLNRDRLRVLRMGGNFAIEGFGGMNYIKPAFSQGLNMLGARRASSVSSRGAGCTFSKFNLGLTHRKALPLKMELVFRADGQYATEKLTPQEQDALGGIDSVRGYPYGDYYADSSVQTNVEFLVPPAFLPDEIKLPYSRVPLKDNIQGILFFDYAFGYRRGKIEGERTFDRMGSLGLGVRVRLYDQMYLRLEWGVPLAPAVDEPMSEMARSRIHFSIDFQDQIPREIARISKIIRGGAAH